MLKKTTTNDMEILDLIEVRNVLLNPLFPRSKNKDISSQNKNKIELFIQTIRNVGLRNRHPLRQLHVIF